MSESSNASQRGVHRHQHRSRPKRGRCGGDGVETPRAELDSDGPLRRHAGPISVLIFGVDGFRYINETYDVPPGSAALGTVAEVLRAGEGPRDVTLRWRRAVLCTVKPSASHAQAVHAAEDIRRRVESATCTSGQLTVSVGVATEPTGVMSRQLVLDCERALRLARRSGSNHVCTAAMVAFEDAADRLPATDRGVPEKRLAELLRLAAGRLGPTQQEHLTSHAAYVSQLSTWLAPLVGMDAASVERVRLAGLMHDLGKFVIPEGVLAKRTPLTPEERSLLARHAADSADMGLRLGADRETTEQIRYHHARFDGPGSMRAKRREEIPLGARVLAVADAFVSMTTHRPYQAARSLAAAVRELRRHCGTQFDPTVVEAVPRALRSRIPTAHGLSHTVPATDR